MFLGYISHNEPKLNFLKLYLSSFEHCSCFDISFFTRNFLGNIFFFTLCCSFLFYSYLTALVLEPDSDNPWTQAGHLDQLFLNRNYYIVFSHQGNIVEPS